MGMPAVRHEIPAVAPRPRLRLVKSAKSANTTRDAGRKQAVSRSNAAAKDAFVFFAVIVAAVALLGVGRVWLSVQAAQASIDSSVLRREIKQERYQGDMLEIQQSVLATPSRIQAIAGTTMGMAPAATVSYLDMRGDIPVDGKVVKQREVASAPGADALVERMMDAAADEAQVLLVGDVGLASSK